jgi:hypothetical protein
VWGRVDARSVRWYRAKAAAGTSLAVEVDSAVFDSKLDPVVTVHGSDRTVLAHKRGAAVEFTSPKGGEFWIALHDGAYLGGDAYPFVIRITAAPRIMAAIPTALKRGAATTVKLLGHRLPGGRPGALKDEDGLVLEESEVSITAPASGERAAAPVARVAGAGMDLWPWALSCPAGRSAPWPFMLVDETVIGPGDVQPPAAVGGLLGSRDAVDPIYFEARKGKALRIDVFSDRLGPPVNPYAVVERVVTNAGKVETHEVWTAPKRGRIFNDRDFYDGTRDPAGRFEPPEDGRYRLTVRDAFALGPNRPRRPFVALLTTAGLPALAVMPTPPPKARDDDRQVYPAAVVLRRGETAPLRLFALRDGEEAAIDVRVDQLPAGVTARAGGLPSGRNDALVLLTAAADAPSGVAPASIAASAAGRLVGVGAATVAWHNPNFDEEPVLARLSRDLQVSVTAEEMAPVTLAAKAPAEGRAGEKVKVDFTVTRRSDWGGNPKLKLKGAPECDKFPEVELDAKATNLVIEINLGEVKLAEGRHTLWLQGMVTVKYQDRPEAVAAADEALKQATAAEAAAKDDAKKAAAEVKKAAEDKKKAAEERAKPRDLVWMLYSQPFVLEVKK